MQDKERKQCNGLMKRHMREKKGKENRNETQTRVTDSAKTEAKATARKVTTTTRIVNIKGYTKTTVTTTKSIE